MSRVGVLQVRYQLNYGNMVVALLSIEVVAAIASEVRVNCLHSGDALTNNSLIDSMIMRLEKAMVTVC
jgi:hypothetical protein